MNKVLAAHHTSRFPRILFNAFWSFIILASYLKLPLKNFQIGLTVFAFGVTFLDFLRLVVPFLKKPLNDKLLKYFVLKGELNQLSSLSFTFITLALTSFIFPHQVFTLCLALHIALPTLVFVSDYFFQKRHSLGAYGLLSGYLGACLISLVFYLRWNIMEGRLFLAVLLTSLFFLFSHLAGHKKIYGPSLSHIICGASLWALFYFFGHIQ